MTKRPRKRENDFAKLHRYFFGSVFTWFVFALLHFPWSYRQFGFWGWILIYSALQALADVIKGAVLDFIPPFTRRLKTHFSNLNDETQTP